MTYRFAIWRLCFSRTLLLARAAVKASSCNGFGCARICAAIASACARVDGMRVDCPVARWHVKLRQEGATLWASGAIAYNMWLSVTIPSISVYKRHR